MGDITEEGAGEAFGEAGCLQNLLGPRARVKERVEERNLILHGGRKLLDWLQFRMSKLMVFKSLIE